MDERFSLPESSWEILSKIINGYFATYSKKEKFSIQDVSNRTGIDKTMISRNNKFLISINVLKKEDGKYVLTQEGINLGLALDHNNQESIKNSIIKLLSSIDFISQVADAVRIRGGMDYETLVSHIMMLASVPKEARYKTGSAALIDIMFLAGFLAKDGTFITAVKNVEIKVPAVSINCESPSEKIAEQEKVTIITGKEKENKNLNINIEITINTKELIEDGEKIGLALHKLIKKIEMNEGEL